jgi:nucleoid DNA-binding protein
MSVIHRTIKAILHPNPLKSANGTYLARISKYNTLSIKDICNLFRSKYNTSINPDTMEYYVKLFLDEMSEQLENGHKINTGYFTACASVRGAFQGRTDNFDKERHRVIYKFSTGHLLRKRAAETQAEILNIIPISYGIQQVFDTFSNSENDLLTPGKVLKIKGEKVKLVGDNPDVGVYFMHIPTGEHIKVLACDVIQNQNARLMVVVPELTPGNYQLEIQTQYAGKGVPLNKPRTTTFADVLRVV